MASTDWVAISQEEQSRGIVNQIRREISSSPYYGSTRDITMIDVYMAAAALAIQKNIKPTHEYKRETDMTAKNYITDNMQWFMCMLFYHFDPDKDLSKLDDKALIVRTFEQYAQAGLPYLLDMCKSRNSMDEFKRAIDKG